MKLLGWLFHGLGLGWALFFYASNAALAQNPPSAAAPAARGGAPAGSSFKPLVLTVLDSETGKPVAGARISLNIYIPAAPGPDGRPQEMVTGEDGKWTLRVPSGGLRMLNISVVHSNYAMRQLSMQGQGQPLQDVPSEFTMRLTKGASVGGFVRDEKGQGIAGAKVVVWGNSGDRYGAGEQRLVEMSSIHRNEGNGVVTDGKGFWEFRNVPPEIDNLYVDVIRPEGAMARFSTELQERFAGENVVPIRLGALRATNAVLKLKDGTTVRGLVVDAGGKPIGNVRIRERRGISAFGAPFAVTNQPDGQFELKNREANVFLLTAEAEGFAINSVTVTPAGMRDVRIVLSPAMPLRLRVVGERDEPLANATVRPIEQRNRGHILDWSGNTDADGRVVWTNAPQSELSFYVNAGRYPQRAVRVAPNRSEQVVVLRKDTDKRISLKVKAADAESGQPVTKFEVRRTLSGDRTERWGEPGKDGVFQGELTQGDPRTGYISSYRLQVRAEGYSSWTSEPFYFDEGGQEVVARLEKGVLPAGIVLQPDGQPANQARVILNTSRNSLFVNESRNPYLQAGMTDQKTGPDGQFRFEAAEPEHRLLFWHATGFAYLSVADLRKTTEVRLQPWARVEGVVQVAGKPKANERVSIKYPVNWTGLNDYHVIYSARTDAEGRFVITNVPPGTYVLYRTPYLIMGPTIESHRQIVEVKAGEVKQVTTTLGGRTVIGHVDADGAVQWQHDPHVLVLKAGEPPPAPTYSFGDVKAYEKARQEYAQSPELQAYERKRNQFQLVFDKNGDFRVEDVPPGDYELRLRATKASDDRNARFSGREEVLGTLIKDVTIPPGKMEEEVDLGSFELEMKNPQLVSAEPISLQAETLDGKPFDLASVRGKPVVLTFWARWAPSSKEQLEALRAAQAASKGVTFLTVNLDEDPAQAKAGLRGLEGANWVHTRLAGAARANVTEELAVNALPVTFLLDDNGRAVSRDVTGTRLQAAIKRLTSRTAKK